MARLDPDPDGSVIDWPTGSGYKIRIYRYVNLDSDP